MAPYLAHPVQVNQRILTLRVVGRWPNGAWSRCLIYVPREIPRLPQI